MTFDLAPPLISATASAKGLGAWFSSWRGPIGYEIRDLNTTMGDGTAFCHSLNRLNGTNTDGEKSDIWFRQMLCLGTSGGFVASVPFYMDGSYRAAVDLEP